jgi:SAM-dependent methyltransferase
VIETIKNVLNAQQFGSGLLGLWVNPFYLARNGLHREICRLAPMLRGRLLDVGCGQKPYRQLFAVDEYIGLELDTPENRARKQADHYYDGIRLPFPDESFDSVLCNQVLEHVFTPEDFLSEIRRVLKPGGKLLLTVPFVWDEHEQPWDYARYTTFGLKHLLEKTGFVVAEQHRVNADVRALFQMINGYIYKTLRTRYPWLNLLVCVMLISPITILGVVLYKLLPANPDLYLDQLVLAKSGKNV